MTYTRKKAAFALQEIYDSGVVEYLHKTFHPTCIVLFGSMQKGEYTYESDVDIFIQAKEKDFDVSVYEKRLGKPLQVFFNQQPRNIPPRLLNNIANGFCLSGILHLFDDADK